MKLRDKMWLWGHPESCYNHEYGNEKESRMTPMEGCLYLGVRNTFVVPVGVDVNRRQYNKSFKTLLGVGWECYDATANPEKYEHFKKLTPTQRRLFGCYLWNFGECKEATGDAVRYQLDFYREKILAGEAEGVVFHTNTMADLDYEAYDATLEWMAEHGDEEV